MSLSLGVLFGLFSLLGYGISNAMSKIPVQKIGEVQTAFWRNVFLTGMIALLLPLELPLTLNIPMMAFTFFIGLVGYIGLFYFYKGLKTGKVGMISPIANSSVIVTVILALLILGENPSLLQYLAIGCVILGIITISVNIRDWRSSDLFSVKSGVPYAFIPLFFWGTLFFLLAYSTQALGPILTAFCLESSLIVGSFFHMKVRKEKLSFPKSVRWLLVGVGLLGGVGTLFYLMGINVAPVSIVAALSAANPLAAVIYGAIVYKEKLHKGQYFAIALMIGGIVLLSV